MFKWVLTQFACRAILSSAHPTMQSYSCCIAFVRAVASKFLAIFSIFQRTIFLAPDPETVRWSACAMQTPFKICVWPQIRS